MSDTRLFLDRHKCIVGMIHVGALPGTPRHRPTIHAIAAQAVEEAELYAAEGVDALMIENMHDVPYLNGAVGAEIVAGMTVVGERIVTAVDLPLGVQILAAANREALAVAHAIGAAFVRVENFAYAHVADEGLMPTADAGPLLRYRRKIGAEAVKIVADVKKKHSSHAVTADVSLAEAAETTGFFGADAIVVTGAATGKPTSPVDLAAVRSSVAIPVCVGSGTTPENLPDLWPHADAFIVGSYFKQDGLWSNPVDGRRVAEFLELVRRLRSVA